MWKRVSEKQRRHRRRKKLRRSKRLNSNNHNFDSYYKRILAKTHDNLRSNTWDFIPLQRNEIHKIYNVNFLNSQNYITWNNRNFRLFYYSKEKRQNYIRSKILIKKINVDTLEKMYIKFHNLAWLQKKTKWYKIYGDTKFLYLVKNK